MCNEKEAYFKPEMGGGRERTSETENSREMEDMEAIEALIADYHRNRDKEKPLFIPLKDYETEKDAKNMAYAFILSHGLFEEYKSFVAEIGENHIDPVEICIVSSYYMAKDKEENPEN